MPQLRTTAAKYIYKSFFFFLITEKLVPHLSQKPQKYFRKKPKCFIFTQTIKSLKAKNDFIFSENVRRTQDNKEFTGTQRWSVHFASVQLTIFIDINLSWWPSSLRRQTQARTIFVDIYYLFIITFDIYWLRNKQWHNGPHSINFKV